MDNRLKGQFGEDLARRDYAGRGFEVVALNYRCAWGEIDLIVKDDSFLVFCEVKLRGTRTYGGAAFAVTPAKRRRLIKSARAFISENTALDNLQPRFDVYCIQINQKCDKIFVESEQLIENAFEVKEEAYDLIF